MCFTAFVSASCTIRYTARAVCAGSVDVVGPQLHLPARRPDPLDEVLAGRRRVGENGSGRSALVRLQHLEEPVELVERGPADRLDGGERLPREGRVVGEDPPPDAGLKHHHVDRVPERVVQFAGQPGALLQEEPLGGQGLFPALGAAPCLGQHGLRPAAAQFADDDGDEEVDDDAGQLAQRSGAVEVHVSGDAQCGDDGGGRRGPAARRRRSS